MKDRLKWSLNQDLGNSGNSRLTSWPLNSENPKLYLLHFSLSIILVYFLSKFLFFNFSSSVTFFGILKSSQISENPVYTNTRSRLSHSVAPLYLSLIITISLFFFVTVPVFHLSPLFSLSYYFSLHFTIHPFAYTRKNTYI